MQNVSLAEVRIDSAKKSLMSVDLAAMALNAWITGTVVFIFDWSRAISLVMLHTRKLYCHKSKISRSSIGSCYERFPHWLMEVFGDQLLVLFGDNADAVVDMVWSSSKFVGSMTSNVSIPARARHERQGVL